jgi:hypothetical protein
MLKSLFLCGASAMLLLAQGAIAERRFFAGKYKIAQAESHVGYITPARNNHEVNLTPREHVWQVEPNNGGFSIRSVEHHLYLKAGVGRYHDEKDEKREKEEIRPVALEPSEQPEAWSISEFDEISKSYRIAPLGDRNFALSHIGPEDSPLVLQRKEYGNKATHQLWRFVKVPEDYEV